MVPPHRDDPHLYYKAARACPVTQSPSFGAFMVARYDDIRRVIDDPVTFSSAASLPMIYQNPPEVVAELEGHVPETTLLVNEDLPGHTGTRAVFNAGFSGARVRAQLPTMRERAEELIGAFADGRRADLVHDYAHPFVETVLNAVIGFPRADAKRISAWTDAVTLLWNPLAPVDGKIEAAIAMRDYTDYLQALIDERRAERRDDLVSDLVHGTDEHPGLDDGHIQNLLRGARVAGYDTTLNAITSTVLAMLQNPEIWSAATGQLRTVPRVIEETLRREAPHRGLMRITTREVELGGTTLPAGAPLLLLFGSANRDESTFPEPDAVILDRPNVRDHLAFGAGMHVCPGAPTARAEIRVAVEALVGRLPGLRLAEGYEPTYTASYFFRGLEALDVTW